MQINQVESSKVRVRSAYVAKPNTPESDLMEKVLHIVEGDLEGQFVNALIWATDPMDAIAQANKMPHHLTWNTTK